jgi:hypothetical protein
VDNASPGSAFAQVTIRDSLARPDILGNDSGTRPPSWLASRWFATLMCAVALVPRKFKLDLMFIPAMAFCASEQVPQIGMTVFHIHACERKSPYSSTVDLVTSNLTQARRRNPLRSIWAAPDVPGGL